MRVPEFTLFSIAFIVLVCVLFFSVRFDALVDLRRVVMMMMMMMTLFYDGLARLWAYVVGIRRLP